MIIRPYSHPSSAPRPSPPSPPELLPIANPAMTTSSNDPMPSTSALTVRLSASPNAHLSHAAPRMLFMPRPRSWMLSFARARSVCWMVEQPNNSLFYLHAGIMSSLASCSAERAFA
eukprot:1531658-Pyramimonas_sp.AAC.2